MVLAKDIVDLAETQVGKRYIFGAEVAVTWAAFYSAKAWDCSELTHVTCNLKGIALPDGSQIQRRWCKVHISVAKARSIRGALLFTGTHVAFSDGKGGTVEAANSRVGVIRGSIGSRFYDAALINGVNYPELKSGPDVEPPSGTLAELQRAVFFAKQYRFGAPNGPGVLNENSPGANEAIKFVQAGINNWGERWARLTNTPMPQKLTSGKWDDLTRLCVSFIQKITGHNELGTTGPMFWQDILPA